jgi:DNA repair exonuclease SbcCD ATPase subunit
VSSSSCGVAAGIERGSLSNLNNSEDDADDADETDDVFEEDPEEQIVEAIRELETFSALESPQKIYAQLNEEIIKLKEQNIHMQDDLQNNEAELSKAKSMLTNVREERDKIKRKCRELQGRLQSLEATSHPQGRHQSLEATSHPQGRHQSLEATSHPQGRLQSQEATSHLQGRPQSLEATLQTPNQSLISDSVMSAPLSNLKTAHPPFR